MSIQKATEQEVRAFLNEFEAWTLLDGKLRREYRFRNFVQAFGFMTQVALLAERANHHPEWSNVYNRVVVDLTTHEAGGISTKDLHLARQVEEITSGG